MASLLVGGANRFVGGADSFVGGYPAPASGAITGTVATSQAQTTSASGTYTPPPITGTVATSQAQTVAANGTYTPAPITGTATTSQAQTISANGAYTPPAISGTVTTSQAQTVAATGSFGNGITGTVTSSQAQSTAATGTVTNLANAQVFGARDEGAQLLANKVKSNRLKAQQEKEQQARDAEIKALLLVAQAKALPITKIAPLKKSPFTQTLVGDQQQFSFKQAQKTQAIIESISTPPLLVDDEFDIDLVMALFIEMI